MYSESDLDGAVSAGVLQPEAATAFRDYVAASRAAPAADEEQFRFLTGFNDVFVALALLLVFVPLLSAHGVIVAGLAWALAEFFTRRRRMALPSILLLLAFIWGCYSSTAALLGAKIGWSGLSGLGYGGVAIAGTACATAAALHWWRFQVPITFAAGTAALVGVGYALLSALLPPAARLWTVLAFGLAVFALAMWWDAADPERRTRRTDVAFWLHLLAAPLIAHPVFALIGVFRDAGSSVGTIFALYGLIAAVSLAVDRRALLVSGLGYFAYAVFSTLQSRPGDDAAILPTAILVGASLLLLSALWTPVRSALVVYLPDRLRRVLPPTQRAPVSKGFA